VTIMTKGTIVLATKNTGKIREFRSLTKTLDVEILPLDVFDLPPTEETGSTFEENSLIKARTVAEAVGLATIADDSGLEVDALNGRPGIYSARYSGPDATDASNVTKLLAELHDVPMEHRTAAFRCVVTLFDPTAEQGPLVHQTTARAEGLIIDERRGQNGFGYDPVFFVSDLGKTFAELEGETKNRLSHRGKAVRLMITFMKHLFDAS